MESRICPVEVIEKQLQEIGVTLCKRTRNQIFCNYNVNCGLLMAEFSASVCYIQQFSKKSGVVQLQFAEWTIFSRFNPHLYR